MTTYVTIARTVFEPISVQVTADDEAAAIQEAEQSAIHPHYTGATREGSASLAPLKSWLS